MKEAAHALYGILLAVIGLEPVPEVASMLKRRLESVFNHCKHEITNAVAEGLNSKIMAINRRACRYRNKVNIKLSIDFFWGGLELCPRQLRQDHKE